MSTTVEATATTPEVKVPKGAMLPADFPEQLVCEGCGQTVDKAELPAHFYGAARAAGVEGAIWAPARQGCKETAKQYRAQAAEQVAAGTRVVKPRTGAAKRREHEILLGARPRVYRDEQYVHAGERGVVPFVEGYVAPKRARRAKKS